MNASDNPTPEPTPTAEPLYIAPRHQPPSEAQKRKQELRGKMQRLHVFDGKVGEIRLIGGAAYNIGPRGNLQKISGQVERSGKTKTKRGGRGQRKQPRNAVDLSRVIQWGVDDGCSVNDTVKPLRGRGR